MSGKSAVMAVGEKIVVDLRIGTPEVTIALEPQVTIIGRVRDPNGKPVRDATVRLVRAPSGAWSDRLEHRAFYTDGKGQFTAILPSSDEGKYNLMVHDGGRRRREDGDHSYDPHEWRKWANGVGPLLATTAGQTINDVELRLTRPGAIRGRAVDQAGKPIARAMLHSVAADNREGVFHNPAARSDSDGNFELRFVRPGSHRIFAGESEHPRGSKDSSAPLVEVTAGETTNARDVTISSDDVK